MKGLQKPCLTCGDLSPLSYCAEHIPKVPDLRTCRKRNNDGRNSLFNRLSLRARSLQDFCSDCGSREDLTADHLPQAWERFYAGQSVRLEDVEVCCRACNSARGESKPGSKRFADWEADTRGATEPEGDAAPRGVALQPVTVLLPQDPDLGSNVVFSAPGRPS